MDVSTDLLVIAFISLIAAISPGPDFVIVLKNSLSHSRKAGFITALGVATALIFHLAYTLLGIGVVIAESPLFYNIVRYAGVAYLFYIGISGIASSFKKPGSVSEDVLDQPTTRTSHSSNFVQGFLTNLLNPKAAMFFISLFSQFIGPETPILVRVEFAVVNWAVSLGWFLLLAYMVTAKKMMGKIDRFRGYVDRVMGGALILLGMKLLLI